jgi:hypothetical protein
LIEGNPVDSNQVPDEWKHLPSLGIPDGAHNYTKGSKQVVNVSKVSFMLFKESSKLTFNKHIYVSQLGQCIF